MVIAYYGNGKGKTTAALGIALRALGRGLQVAVLQFIKGDPQSGANNEPGAIKWTTGERLINNKLSILRNGSSATAEDGQIPNNKFFIKAVGEGFYKIEGDQLPEDAHRRAADKGFAEARDIIEGGAYKVVILDEIIRAVAEELVTEKQVIELIELAREKKLHLVLTGHTISQNLIDQMDLVTEMKKIKHPFDEGKLAEVGIDY